MVLAPSTVRFEPVRSVTATVRDVWPAAKSRTCIEGVVVGARHGGAAGHRADADLPVAGAAAAAGDRDVGEGAASLAL